MYSIVMYCIVFYCLVLYCTVLHYIELYCIILNWIVSYYIELYCIVLYCIEFGLNCIVLYCIVLYCIVLYCIVLYCIVLYCIIASNLKYIIHWHCASTKILHFFLFLHGGAATGIRQSSLSYVIAVSLYFFWTTFSEHINVNVSINRKYSKFAYLLTQVILMNMNIEFLQ